MKLFTEFMRRAPNKVFLSVVLGTIAGIGYSALIPLVLISVQPKDESFVEVGDQVDTVLGIEVASLELAILFFSSCFLILAIRTISEVILLRVAALVAKDFRTRFYHQISNAPIAALEKLGSSKLIASINIDVPRVVMGARIIPGLLINSVSLVGMLGFLLYLNAEVFKLVIMAIVFGVITYQIPMLFGRKIFTRSRNIRDELQEGIRGLVYGAKELKLSSEKRAVFFEKVLNKHEQEILKNDKLAHTIVNVTSSFGELMSFFVIGLVSFVFVNYHSMTQQELIGVVMALLYLVGPMGIILNAIPQLTVSMVSVRKIGQLLKAIPNEEIERSAKDFDSWQSIKFNKVYYQYESPDDEPGFEVGPISIEIEKGKITFIIGANGSGKSTLSKLITLHYLPQKGTISFGNQPIDRESVFTFRQSISAIYSDYFLFDQLLINVDSDKERLANEYLDLLHLSSKVKITDGRFSTISLSDGQRKRLALLVAFLEDKPVYLFDEWAADQDPVFKRVFYHRILPELKKKNKAVIVISHDDKYFHVADKIIVMEQGSAMSKANQELSNTEKQSMVEEFC
ncbi:cyclic peptide export ABC transporter [Aliikangiella sp. G2MR2-5]|uniref:cyclic peptide export ABC transporter n=1 Tax=Aliikangiella sp. G2MR2-5 TaxID=2788943 RepID=UPI0018A9689F|nr:cyclic peptide export ABC transporter [Aliikangiella sp. G2MR2-5]